MKLEGKTVMITGASSAFGLALIPPLGRRQVQHLILSDNTPPEITPELRAKFARIDALGIDLSTETGIDRGLEELGERIRSVDVLVINVGRFGGGLLEDQSPIEFGALVNINLMAPIQLAQRFLPFMIGRDEAVIVFNASVNSILHFPCYTTYTAGKAGLLAFSDSLRRELRGTGLRTLTLITPAMETESFRRAKRTLAGHVDTEKWKGVDPTTWAEKTIDALVHDRTYLYPSGRMKLLLSIARHFPRIYDLYCARVFSRHGVYLNSPPE